MKSKKEFMDMSFRKNHGLNTKVFEAISEIAYRSYRMEFIDGRDEI